MTKPCTHSSGLPRSRCPDCYREYQRNYARHIRKDRPRVKHPHPTDEQGQVLPYPTYRCEHPRVPGRARCPECHPPETKDSRKELAKRASLIRWGYPAIGTSVRRKPNGFWCKVAEVDSVARRIKIYSPFWTGWVSKNTFEQDWVQDSGSEG